MKIRVIAVAMVVAASVAGLLGCRGAGTVEGRDALHVDDVFFAQQHVLRPDDPLFELVGDLDALIKVNVYSPTPVRAPRVMALLALDGRTTELRLRGPRRLPPPPQGEPALMEQSYLDSFTAVVPRHWIRPGLRVAIELRSGETVIDRREIEDLRVGAPNRMVMTMYDIHFFGRELDKDYPEGWRDELEAKLPVCELELRRVRGNSFETLVMPPRGEKPAARCSSPEEYKEKTGLRFDGEQAISLKWNSALHNASGSLRGLGHSFLSIYGVPCGGQAWFFRGVGNGKASGILIHELGHTFRLPDSWRPETGYPYHGHMYGIKTTSETQAHAGPTWAFDLKNWRFIPPIVQEGAPRGTPGTWKRDPMAGGGWGDQPEGYHFRHYSDYSVFRIREFMEKESIRWNPDLEAYVTWDEATHSYTKRVDTEGQILPIERDVEVVSILMTTSGVTPEANIVYPPIGPYTAQLIRLYNAASADDRRLAQENGFSDETCNTCLRVTQGGAVTTYLVKVKATADEDPLSQKGFHVYAINLPARDGEVTQVDLLRTPGVLADGVPDDSTVLYSWKK